MTTSLPSYEEIQVSLMRKELGVTPSELQGIIIGLHAAGLPLQDSAWRGHLYACLSTDESLHASIDAIARPLHGAIVSTLEEAEEELALYLPEDEEFIVDRAEALIYWCQGFMLGFNTLNSPRALTDEAAREAYDDIEAISHLDLDSISEAEQDEKDLFSLIEHVKVSTLLVFHALATMPAASNTVH